MATFQWTAAFDTGTQQIDDQHRALMGLINQLDEPGAGGVDAVMEQLTDFARHHFANEERLLAEQHLSEERLREHLAAHADFTQRVTAAAQRDLGTPGVRGALVDFLQRWLPQHVLERDMVDLGVSTAQDAATHATDVMQGALAEATSRFEELADETPMLMWHCDANGHRYWFDRTSRDFVGTRSPLDGPTWESVIVEEDLAEYRRVVAEALAQHASCRVEFRARRVDGKVRWLQETLVPRYERRSRFLGLMGCSLDITAQRDALAVLRGGQEALEAKVAERTAELQAAVEALTVADARREALLTRLTDAEAGAVEAAQWSILATLASGAAHEINNPLAYIAPNIHELAHLVEDLVAGGKDESARAAIAQDAQALAKEALGGLERIAQVIASLRSFSGVRGNSGVLDVNAAVASVLTLMGDRLTRLKVVQALTVLPRVHCSSSDFTRALAAVLDNAAWAVGPGGQVTLRTSVEGDEVCCAVIDTGVGMAPEVLEHVFDPFFTARPQGQGQGLGLTVARNLLRHHRGELTAQSEQGKGSTFTLRLPVQGLSGVPSSPSRG